MSGSTRSRQKRKLEPISIEELAGTTGMSGFCTFLTRDSSVRVPALEALEEVESSAPETPAPEPPAAELSACTNSESAAPEIPVPNIGAAESSAPASQMTEIRAGAVESDALELGASDEDAPETGAVDSFVRRRIRIREAVTVQDAHSLAEQAVYDAMYRAGRPYQGDSRILTIGLRSLAELSRMAYSNCKANVRSLVTKLAIDERPGFSYIEGRTYVVYSFREILRRRKAAGLTHVVRNRGVAFVDPATGVQIELIYGGDSAAPQSSAPVSRAVNLSAIKSISSAPSREQAGAPAHIESGAPVPSAHIENRHLLRNSGEESSSVPAGIVTALRAHISDVDDEAACQLWHRCREHAPDAQPEEVTHFIHVKAGRSGIRMPLGFLLTAVPKCFAGDSFRQFRLERAQAVDAAASRDRQFASEVLKNPEADEEQKEWARGVLGLENQ
jgi:hypothetical protein